MLLENIINNIINSMTPYLNKTQLDHLSNTIYINLHDYEIHEKTTNIVPISDNSNTFKIKMFIASKRAINRKDTTLHHYVKEIKNVLDFLGKNIEDITGMDLRYYYGMMRECKHIKTSTIQTRLRYLSSFYDFLVTEELVKSNPVKKVGILKLEKTIKSPYSNEEIEALRVSCNTLRDRAIIEFLYSTGVRISELVALNVNDIKIEKQELTVLGKGSKERKTYITDLAKFHLLRYLKERCVLENISMEELQTRPLFTTLDSPHNRLSIAGIQYMLRKLGERANVKNVHPHRFRRTIATDLLAREMPIEQVKAFLGHERLDTTMIYCTIKDENVHASFRKFA